MFAVHRTALGQQRRLEFCSEHEVMRIFAHLRFDGRLYFSHGRLIRTVFVNKLKPSAYFIEYRVASKYG
jgi:hypothetical protein